MILKICGSVCENFRNQIHFQGKTGTAFSTFEQYLDHDSTIGFSIAQILNFLRNWAVLVFPAVKTETQLASYF